MCFIDDQNTLKYYQTLQDSIKDGKDEFELYFPNADHALIKLVRSMVQFNPYFRPTAAECLNSKLFDQIRSPDQEAAAPRQIELEIDAKSELASDYEQVMDGTYDFKDGQLVARLNKILVREIQSFK